MIKYLKLVENLEFIHPAEVEICNKLAELGSYYKQMEQFVEDYTFGKSYENKNLKCKSYKIYLIWFFVKNYLLKDGLYLTALCESLNLVVLTPYRLDISDLEKSLLKEHYLNVTFLQTHLENVSFIWEIQSLKWIILN